MLLVLAGGTGLIACSESSGDADSAASNGAPPQRSVTTVSALMLTLNSEYPSRSFYTGRVEAARASDLGFELGGLLETVAVDEGDYVATGQVLARLDTDRLTAQLNEADAGRVQAEAQSSLAQSTLNRLIEAREFDGVSQQQLDEASNAAATTRAAVLAAESRLARVKVDVAKARLLAPYDAVVLNRHHDEGQVLAPGQAVLSIQDTAELRARVGVAGSATDRLEVGGQYTLIINDQPVAAILRSILPVRDAVARTVDALFTLPLNSNGRVQADQKVAADAASSLVNEPAFHTGDLVRLELRRTVEAEGYWVPLSALAEGERGLWNAYVLVRQAQPENNSTHVVQSRAVEVLYQDGSRAFVNGALQPDEQIVPTGLNRIVPGQQVSIYQEGQ